MNIYKDYILLYSEIWTKIFYQILQKLKFLVNWKYIHHIYLLVPGTLSIFWGPQNKENVTINYEICDEKIAKITKNYPDVYAKIYEETILKITLLYKYYYYKFFYIKDDKKIINRTDVLYIENVSFRVDFLYSVEILGG